LKTSFGVDMKEEFLHYLWKYRLFNPERLTTANGEPVQILNPGQENHDAGPDFLAAKIRIGETVWAGHVEIHTSSSHWYRHRHQEDAAYGNIILHVVYEHDREAFTHQGELLPVIELKGKFNESLLHNYHKLLAAKSWVPCHESIGKIDRGYLSTWLHRILVERLERKSEEVLHFYKFFNQDWEQTFYFLLARNLGFKANTQPFGMLAQRTPFKMLLRSSSNLASIEAMLFGQSGLLPKTSGAVYPRALVDEYRHQQRKHQLEPMPAHLWKFAKLRPAGFPTIRIAQLAMLIHKVPRLFSALIDSNSLKEILALLRINTSPYWDTHFVFDKTSPARTKTLGTDAINSIITNTLAPALFVYGKHSLQPHLGEKAIDYLAEIPSEKNAIIAKWKQLEVSARNAGESQALLELKKYYCTPKKCLHCAVGHKVLMQ
jgi:hypothetical protein